MIREPDTVLVKQSEQPEKNLSLEPGDVALGFGFHAHRNMALWAKGVWCTEYWEYIAEKGKCGFAAGFGAGGCSVGIVKNGASEGWVHFETGRGLRGWVLARKFEGDNSWSKSNFSDLCLLPDA